MKHTLRTLLLAVCLISLNPVLAATEGDADEDVAVAAAEPRYIADVEKGELS